MCLRPWNGPLGRGSGFPSARYPCTGSPVSKRRNPFGLHSRPIPQWRWTLPAGSRHLCIGYRRSVQGYLAHNKKQPPPQGPPQGPRNIPTAGSQEGAVSYERGTLVCIGYRGSVNATGHRFLPRSSAPGGLNVIQKEAWLFCRTSSGVRLCWELKEAKGPKGPKGLP